MKGQDHNSDIKRRKKDKLSQKTLIDSYMSAKSDKLVSQYQPQVKSLLIRENENIQNSKDEIKNSLETKNKAESSISNNNKSVLESLQENSDLALKFKGNCSKDNCDICSLESLIDQRWVSILKEEFIKDYFLSLKNFLHSSPIFYPPSDLIFNFTKSVSFENIKVVIVGQDPYHNKNQAMGLSFSVPKGIPIPPSLRNIYSELEEDICGFKRPKHGDLSYWASQGVLLLNDTLTVSPNLPASHSKFGWKNLTTQIIKLINEKLKNVVFILWGNHAKSKSVLLDSSVHLILESGHPSPMSVKTFKGCRHFSKTNEYLVSHNKKPIDWCL